MGFDNDHLGTLMPFGAPSTPSFADGLTNGSNRPFAGLLDWPHERARSEKAVFGLRRWLRQRSSRSVIGAKVPASASLGVGAVN